MFISKPKESYSGLFFFLTCVRKVGLLTVKEPELDNSQSSKHRFYLEMIAMGEKPPCRTGFNYTYSMAKWRVIAKEQDERSVGGKLPRENTHGR
jgi:hypothetical protein